MATPFPFAGSASRRSAARPRPAPSRPEGTRAGEPAVRRGNASYPLPAEGRRDAAAIEPERALFADRVGTLEDPVLPGAQAAENLGLQRLGPGKAQIRLHPRQRVGREARALLKQHAQLVVPVEILVGRGDEAERLRGFARDRLAHLALERRDRLRLAKKPRLQTREAVAHGIARKSVV